MSKIDELGIGLYDVLQYINSLERHEISEIQRKCRYLLDTMPRKKKKKPCKSVSINEFQEKLIVNATKWEMEFKNCLRAWNVCFEFQKILNAGGTNYIVDFFIPLKREDITGLIIELDGSYHKQHAQRIKDLKRTKRLEAKRYKVIRFSNEQVYADIAEIKKRIFAHQPLICKAD